MPTRGVRTATELRGLWLNPGPVSTSIKPLLLHMLERTHPDPVLREAVLEELGMEKEKKRQGIGRRFSWKRLLARWL